MPLEKPENVELLPPVRRLHPAHLQRRPVLFTLAAAGAIAALVASLSGSGAYMPGFGPARNADKMSSERVAALWESISDISLKPLPTGLDDPHVFARAVAGMREPPTEAERLIKKARAEARRIVILTLWDNMDEDGDIIDVRVGGQSWTVPLRTEPTALTVIYTPGETITLTGKVDGAGGGVTAGLGLNTGPLPLPPLAVGQSITLPLE
jgi:hypothetical protein